VPMVDGRAQARGPDPTCRARSATLAVLSYATDTLGVTLSGGLHTNEVAG
jgi:hypothetical protein